MAPTTKNTDAPDFAALLAQATTEPGRLSAAYFAFHSYSLGNMLLAYAQLEARGMALGPIASFNRWRELGRFVKKGEKAIELCMPITCKRTIERADDAGSVTAEDATFTRFVFRRNWFTLAQTDGQPYEPPARPDWNRARALEALNVTEIAFDHLDGNCQGFARDRSIAINPIAANPYKTTFHELAHVLIGHTVEAEMRDDERTARNIRELEAEATAMLVCDALQLPGLEESRAYIQHWYGTGQPVPETSARRIFKAADQILKAGKETLTDGSKSPMDDPHDREIDR
jgi:antirestriction protein ArdC